jgi:type IV secretory pathway VirB3-like protein
MKFLEINGIMIQAYVELIVSGVVVLVIAVLCFVGKIIVKNEKKPRRPKAARNPPPEA